jgi:uncharacterized repeat protein (TIGR03806 family)
MQLARIWPARIFAGRRLAAMALAAAGLLLASAAPPAPGVDDALILGDTLPQRLSDYRFFVDGRPNRRVLGYRLNTPLFSDYADKDRFIYVPAGSRAHYAEDGAIDFPVGSALIKSFSYPVDARRPGGARRTVETRVLLRRASGWVALPYVWSGDDAVLRRGGTRLDIGWTDAAGRARTVSYGVPNANQCKECHQSAGALVPIGPKARNLDDGHQLTALAAAGLVDRAPPGIAPMPRADDARAPLAARARAYLDINCAHCHSRAGMASNSGLYLGFDEPDPVARGRLKRPVAAGRGSAGLAFDILPGQPDQSILLHRMASTEPGIAMPELGRTLAHDEGVALIRAYIAEMK